MHIEDIFTTMEYGPISQSDNEAKKWIHSHQSEFGSLIANQWKSDSADTRVEVVDVASNERLASVKHGSEHLREAVQSSRATFSEWFSSSALVRSRILKGVAGTILKHSHILAALESITTGRLIKQVQSTVIPQAVRNFQYIAEWPYAHTNENKNYKPLGAYVVVVPADSSLSLVAQKLAPSIAAGNGTILCLDGSSTKNVNLALYYFAEVLSKNSFPCGVFNLVFNPEPIWTSLAATIKVDGISYVGRMEGAQKLQQYIAGSGVKLNLFLDSKYLVAIFECGDVESAVEASIEAIKVSFENDMACLILVQEAVYGNVLRLLKYRLGTQRIGSSLDSTADFGPSTSTALTALIEHLADIEPGGATQIQLNNLDIAPFRTTREALELANDCVTDQRASVWTETVTLALEFARNLKASTVWVNCINQYDASVTVGNQKQSGGARDLGDESFYQYVRHSYSDCPSLPYGTVSNDVISSYATRNSDDLKKAVDVAARSISGWNALGHAGRAKVFWGALDALAEERQQFQETIKTLKCSADAATASVEGAIGLLHYWASHSDDGRVYNVNFRGNVVKISEPVGVIVIALSDDIQYPVFTFMALVFSAVALGNAVVVLPGKNLATLALSTLQLLNKGGLPSGVINILPEDAETWLSGIFASNIQDVWYIGSENHLAAAEFLSGSNQLQPICGRTGFNSNNWDSPKLAEEFFVRASQSKMLWMPSGVTFAN